MSTESQQESRHPDTLSGALVFSIWIAISAVLICIFRWTLVEYVTQFVEPLLETAVAVLFLSSVVWSVIHAVIKRRFGIMKALAPIGINIATVIIVIFVPFTRITIDLDFRFHLNARTNVARDVLAGKYDNSVQNAGGRGDLIPLSGSLSSLSSGGEIVRLRRSGDTLILFFSFRGILDSFSGFVYSSDDVPPVAGDFGTKFVENERLRQNWYWIASKN